VQIIAMSFTENRAHKIRSFGIFWGEADRATFPKAKPLNASSNQLEPKVML
jgi:hypothetical protein